MWIRWRPGSSDESPWTEVEVRSVSVRAAFAFLAEPPEAGTRGVFEVRRADGVVDRRGVCRVVFVREGVGAGLELRRAVGPSEAISSSTPREPDYEPAPPSSHFRKPRSSGRARRSSDFPTPPASVRPPPESVRPAASPPEQPATARPPYRGEPTPLAEPRPPTRRPSSDYPTPPASYRPPAPGSAAKPSSFQPPAPPSVDAVFSSSPPPAPDLPDIGDLDLESPDPAAEWGHGLAGRSSFGDDPPPSPIPDLPPSPLSPLPAASPLATQVEVPDDAGLPSLDDFELPPDGGAAFGLPDLGPPSAPPGFPPGISQPPEPEFETYDAQVSASDPPPRPISEPPVGEMVAAEATVAQVATRTRGRGATEGFAIGIDLGTSNTCASIVSDGVPKVIPTRYGTHTVPSVYARVGHRVLVGEPAVKRMVLDPRETIYGSKRLVGRAYTEELAFDYQPYFAYRLAETRDHHFGAAIDNDVVSFEEVATALLEEVRDVASRHLGGPIDRAVITVPAYFTEVQREAVKRAARAARLMVDQLVPEPTAAALAHGYSQTQPGNYVVFDLGGGTFDVSVMRAQDGEFQVLAIGGDPFLGGIDVDDMIANYLLEELHRELRTRVDPTAQQLARLREMAEECKRGLSVQETFAVSAKHFTTHEGRPFDLNVTVSRSVLEGLAAPFIERLLQITRETVAAAGLVPQDVHELLLVGGMSRMPLVHSQVEELFSRRADRRLNPDEAVAIGAGLLASRIREVRLLDVLPLSIGIAVEGRRFLRLVPRNTPLPASKSFVVQTTQDLQTRYELPLYQGERRDAMQNEYLGTLIVEGITAREAGRAIDIELQLDEQAVLSVSARDGITGSPLEVHVARDHSATEAQQGQGSYTGEADAEGARLGSPLGRFFQKVRGLFG